MNLYSNIIKEYSKKLIEHFNDKIKLILVIGSGCSSKVMENWSDIDFILVFDKFDFTYLDYLRNENKNYSVKIGITVYSENEFLGGNTDIKTKYHLYLYQQNIIPCSYNVLDIPKIDIEEVKDLYKIYINDKIHFYKRQFLYSNYDKDLEIIRVLYKNTYLIMKALLIRKGYCPKNYDEVFHLFSKVYNYPYFDYEKFINEYLNNKIEIENYLDYFKKFIIDISKK